MADKTEEELKKEPGEAEKMECATEDAQPEKETSETTPAKLDKYNPDVAVGQFARLLLGYYYYFQYIESCFTNSKYVLTGQEFLMPVTGMFCKACRRFFLHEDQALKSHCRTLGHFNNCLALSGEKVNLV